MTNILIVESKNDQYFIEALVKQIKASINQVNALEIQEYELLDEHSKDLDLNEFQFLGTRSGEYCEVLLEFDRHLELWQAIFDAIVQPYQP